MLVLSRRPGETLVLETSDGTVTLSIRARRGRGAVPAQPAVRPVPSPQAHHDFLLLGRRSGVGPAAGGSFVAGGHPAALRRSANRAWGGPLGGRRAAGARMGGSRGEGRGARGEGRGVKQIRVDPWLKHVSAISIPEHENETSDGD